MGLVLGACCVQAKPEAFAAAAAAALQGQQAACHSQHMHALGGGPAPASSLWYRVFEHSCSLLVASNIVAAVQAASGSSGSSSSWPLAAIEASATQRSRASRRREAMLVVLCPLTDNSAPVGDQAVCRGPLA